MFKDCAPDYQATITSKIIWKQNMALTERLEVTSCTVPALLFLIWTIASKFYLSLRNLRLTLHQQYQTCCCDKTHGSVLCCDDFADTFRSLSAHVQQIWLDQNFEPLLRGIMSKTRKGSNQSRLLLQELCMQAIILPWLYLRRWDGWE